MRYGQPLI